MNVPVPEDRDLEQEWEAQMRQQLPDERTRRSLMDDVPLQIKRKVEFPTEEEAERQVKRLRSNFCATVAASTVFGELQNEWISRYEVDVLRRPGHPGRGSSDRRRCSPEQGSQSCWAGSPRARSL